MLATDDAVEAMARAALEQRGFGFYTDPMEGGQDAYDISLQAMYDARAALAALAKVAGVDAEGFRKAADAEQRTAECYMETAPEHARFMKMAALLRVLAEAAGEGR